MVHNLKPFYNTESQILILGSFPSVKSRAANFYYHHPTNRFWPVLSAIFNEETPTTIPAKKRFLTKHKIALYDVCASCDIVGSSDASIKNVRPTNLSLILKACPLKAIILNGKTASKLYQKYFASTISLPAISLPSTSFANASYTLEKLITNYQVIVPILDEMSRK